MAKLLIEWRNADGKVVAIQQLTVAGAVDLSEAAPAFAGLGNGQARVTVLAGAAYLKVYGDVDATAENATWRRGGQHYTFEVREGDKISALAAAAPGDEPLGYQQITDLSASTALTVPAGATYAIVRAETQAVRWRDDGVAPTAGVGQPLGVGEELDYDGDLAALRFIQQAASAKLNVAYYAED